MAASLSERKNRSASSNSVCANGNRPRAAAIRADGGAAPETIELTNGLVDVS
jgi:hypothetical protein